VQYHGAAAEFCARQPRKDRIDGHRVDLPGHAPIERMIVEGDVGGGYARPQALHGRDVQRRRPVVEGP